jgi:glycosyltransferase involved in cell wall biosynthesis
MRICMVTHSWGDGGLEKHVIELCNALCERHEVALIAHPSMAERLDPRVHFMPVDFTRSRLSPGLIRDLLRALRSWPADIVHAQANKTAEMVGLLRRWIPGRAFVATIHNQKGTTRMFSHFDQVIAVSPGIVPLVSARAPTTAIYNGIRTPAAVADGRQKLAQEFGFDASQPILLGLGRLVEAKGFDILVPAAAQAGVQVLIAGEGPMRPQLEQQIRESGARVVLAGFRRDAQFLMAAADAFILSSRNEGFAYVFVEALLAERPVLATDIPMVRSFLPPELIVPVTDVAALAQALRRLSADLPGWRALMQPAFATAKAELTLEAMVSRTEQVYARALAGGR